jgi:colicin import membrane protein
MSAAAATFVYDEPGKTPSAVLAVLVHLLLAAFLFFGVHWQSRQPDAVMVELWDSLPAPVAEKVEPSPELKPEPAPPPKPEPVPEPRVEKAVEPPKPDIALEKKKEIKKEIPKKPEPKPKKPEPRLDLDRSKDIRAQLERETTALSQQREKNRILDQMRREAATADAVYIGRLKGKIKSNIVLPPDIAGNPEAIFDVVQLPTGEVMSAKLRKSSGHTAYDAAVERAILKSSPLPKPDRPEQFQRNLEIKFRPQD